MAIEFPLTSTGDEAIRVARPGVYPITIEMRTASQELVGRVVTHLIRVGDEPSQRLPLALVVEKILMRSRLGSMCWSTTLTFR